MKKLRIGLILGLVVVEILFFFIMNKVTEIDEMIVFFDMNLFVHFSDTNLIIDFINQVPDTLMWVHRFYMLDTLFPILYGTLIATFLWQYVSKKSLIIIAVAVIVDYTENSLILSSIRNSDMSVFVFNTLKIVSPIKFALIGLAIVLVLIQVGKEHTHENNPTSN